MRTCPNCGTQLPAQRLKWRARIRLYEKDCPEPIADTDPEATAGTPGSTLLQSLPALADHVIKLAHGFHVVGAAEITGLEPDTLRRRLRALRPTISRRKGNAVWRLSYRVIPKRANYEQPYPHDYIARVDVERVVIPP